MEQEIREDWGRVKENDKMNKKQKRKKTKEGKDEKRNGREERRKCEGGE